MKRTMVYFGCGDVASCVILETKGDEICVQMEYGPIWVPVDRVMFYA